ncbi:MAG: primosomal replication protein N [Betaproteobacteria bacterium]
MNQIELTARIAELSPLRYTPAGVPATNVVLEHESEQLEAGSQRQVKLSIKAVAFGTLAEQLAQCELGRNCRYKGFLTSARTNKSVVFHILELNPL